MKKILLLTALAASLLTACSKDNKPEKKDDGGDGFVAALRSVFHGTDLLTITDFEGHPVAGAQILIGDAENIPFAGNFLTADAQGHVALPAAWNSPQTLTVAAPGYVRLTYFAQSPGPQTLRLHPAASKQKYELQGQAQGLPISDFDGYIDFGLVMPALAKTDLLNFDLHDVISAEQDQISTLGQSMNIPSNISMPRQQESYLFFTATLDKARYHTSFDHPGLERMYVIRGRFDFKSVADALRGGQSFFDVVNSFSLTGGGIRDVNLSGAKTSLDLPTTDLKFTAKAKVTAPSYASDESFLAVAASEQSGYLIPTDIKNISAKKSATLSLLPQGDTRLLAVLKKTVDLDAATQAATSADPMSAVLIPFSKGATTPQFLPLLAAPRIAGDELYLPAPASSVAGVDALATYSVLSQVEESTQSGKTLRTAHRVWELYAPAWVSEMHLPSWPQEASLSGPKRWDVSFIGGQKASQEAMGPAIIEHATHVTHSSFDF